MALPSLWEDHAASLASLLQEHSIAISLASIALFIFATCTYLFRKPAFPSNAPPLVKSTWPILGNPEFFSRRWDFARHHAVQSKTGNFSFYAGQWPIVGLSSEAGRRIFFEHKGLGLAEGYGALLGGSPTVKDDNNLLADDRVTGGEFTTYFSKRIIAMLKGNKLGEMLPLLLQDAREMFDELVATPSRVTDPFDSVYRMVFRLTMRAVACREIAESPELLAKSLHLFEEIEATSTPMAIMFPWMPSLAKLKRVYYGSQLYLMFKKVIDDRKKNGIRENDPLQYLLDHGDSTTDIITFVLSALFAGQLNSGITSAYILVFLAQKPYWLERVRQEITEVVNRHDSNTELPLKDRLMKVPIEAWESEFPVIDICLKDAQRLLLHGTAFRKNVSGRDIPLNKDGSEVIPKNGYALFPVASIHLNPDIYENPEEWDPSRYLPDRAEDKKQQYGWIGWGVSRHPCLGMRFAKLEMTLLLAFAMAYFDELQLADKHGNLRTTIPSLDHNNHSARKPAEQIFLKFRVVEDQKVKA